MIEEALEHLQSGNYAAAETLYRRMLEDEPDNPEVLFMLSLTRQGQNDLEEPVELLNRAIGVQPGNPTLHYSLGMVQLRRRELGAAEQAFHAAAGIDPNFVAAQNGIATVEMARGRYAAAEHALRKALRTEPENLQTLTNMGLALLEQDRPDDAINYLQQVLGEQPENASAQLHLGRAFIAAGNPGFAIQCFENALEQEPGNLRALTLLAGSRLDSGQYPEAAVDFRRVLDAGGESAETVSGLARALKAQNRLKESEGAFLRAMRLSNEAEDVLLNLARVQLDMGKARDVIQRLSPRLEQAADSERMARLLAEARLEAGDPAGARELLRPLLSGGAPDSRIRLLLARALLEAGEREAADDQIDRLLEADSPLVDAVLLRAGQELGDGRVAEAVERLRGAQRRHDLDHRQRQKVVGLLGRALHENGQHQAAWEQYLGLDPRTAEVVTVREEKPLLLEVNEPAETAMDREVAWSWPPQPLDDGRPEPVFVFAWPGCGRRDLLRALAGHPGIGVIDDAPASQTERRLLASHPQGQSPLDAMTSAQIQLARRKYWKALTRLDPRAGDLVTVDAMWLTVEGFPTIYRLFPQAHMLLLRQDPRDMALSWLQNGYRDQEGMARLYRRQMGLLERCQAGVPLKYVDVDAAELQRNPGAVLRETLAALSLPWDDGVERSYLSQSRQELPEPGSWKHYEPWLQSVFEALED
ncbi:tetratricopeptide repeat-containing sulfotransferase family protein [Elongatibacter sediminis]|uniref:Tetratricopeptide repeat protein n=1 Tax=Elongatibacter sediminis TaxID=3119006 RepID=A0AAW9RES7_9GAMM